MYIKFQRKGIIYCEDDHCFVMDFDIWASRDLDCPGGYDYTVTARFDKENKDQLAGINLSGVNQMGGIEQRAAKWAEEFISNNGIAELTDV